MTIPIQVRDIGVDGVANTADDQILNLLDRPAATPQTRLFTNPTDPAYDSDFHTMEFAVNRRFANKLDAAHVVRVYVAESVPRRGDRTPARSTRSTHGARLQLAPESAPVRRRGQGNLDAVELQGRSAATSSRTRSAFSGSWKVQSGRQWGRSLSFAFPGDGTQNVRVEEVTANRAPTVSILDFRADKSFSFGRFGKVTGMLDVFNVAEQVGTVINFSTVTGADVQARHRHPRPARHPLRRALRVLRGPRVRAAGSLAALTAGPAAPAGPASRAGFGPSESSLGPFFSSSALRGVIDGSYPSFGQSVRRAGRWQGSTRR